MSHGRVRKFFYRKCISPLRINISTPFQRQTLGIIELFHMRGRTASYDKAFLSYKRKSKKFRPQISRLILYISENGLHQKIRHKPYFLTVSKYGEKVRIFFPNFFFNITPTHPKERPCNISSLKIA